MAKRTATATNVPAAAAAATAIVADLNAEFAPANQAEREAKLAAIPMPIMGHDIPWELVYSDRNFNTREDDSYAFDQNEALYQSLMTYGLTMRGGDNMSFSRQKDGRYLIISGNLRYAMMAIGRENVRALNAKAIEEGRTEDVQELPFPTLFGLVFDGLSRDQETDLMADHMLKKGLTPVEKCREIGEACFRLNLTDKQAAIKYGLKEPNLYRLRIRYTMRTVFEEYKKEMSGKPDVAFIRVGQTALTTLYKAYNLDQKAGCVFREEGVNFRAAWDEYVKSDRSENAVKIKSVDRQAIIDQAKTLVPAFSGDPEVIAADEILSWAANDAKDGATNIQKIVAKLHDYCDSLRAERDMLRSEVENLRIDFANLKTQYDVTLNDFKLASEHIANLESELLDLKAVKVD